MIGLVHELPDLGLLPLLVQGVDIGDGQKADGLLGKQRFAGTGSPSRRRANINDPQATHSQIQSFIRRTTELLALIPA